MRAKEFLSQKGIDYVVIDVLNDPRGREKLLAFGLRRGPAVAKGGKFVFGEDLYEVAKFIGVQGPGHQPLPPEQLIKKWIITLHAAQRALRQIPQHRIDERVIDSRDRSIRILGHHVFRIGEAFLETIVDGIEYTKPLANIPPADGTYTAGEEIARYGDTVIARLQQWWDGLLDKSDQSFQRKVKTYYGMQSIAMLFERSTWHSAQHARQLIAVLERFHIEPSARLTAEDLAGLPMPEGLW